MATQIPGKRIKNGTILLDHLGNFKIPENRLTLNYASHPHSNKAILDRVRYSGASDIIDLGVFESLVLEIVSARRNGLNLGGTIDSKVDKTFIQDMINEIEVARGDNESLYDAIISNASFVENKILEHMGSTEHFSLDNMYADYLAAKQGHASLYEAMMAVSVDPGSEIVINQIRPWTTEFVVSNVNQREFIIPHTYTPNANAIEVFDGPLRMSVDIDYIEKNEESIEFMYNLTMGSVIRVTGTGAGVLYEWVQSFNATAEQRIFEVINSYQVGRDEIIVYESGLLMRKGVDYIELNSKAITFTDSLPVETKVTILKRR